MNRIEEENPLIPFGFYQPMPPTVAVLSWELQCVSSLMLGYKGTSGKWKDSTRSPGTLLYTTLTHYGSIVVCSLPVHALRVS